MDTLYLCNIHNAPDDWFGKILKYTFNITLTVDILKIAINYWVEITNNYGFILVIRRLTDLLRNSYTLVSELMLNIYVYMYSHWLTSGNLK